MAVYVESKASGDLDKIIILYNKNTVQPIQQPFRDAINDRLSPIAGLILILTWWGRLAALLGGKVFFDRQEFDFNLVANGFRV